jgi:hypothetical protein
MNLIGQITLHRLVLGHRTCPSVHVFLCASTHTPLSSAHFSEYSGTSHVLTFIIYQFYALEDFSSLDVFREHTPPQGVFSNGEINVYTTEH